MHLYYYQDVILLSGAHPCWALGAMICQFCSKMA